VINTYHLVESPVKGTEIKEILVGFTCSSVERGKGKCAYGLNAETSWEAVLWKDDKKMIVDRIKDGYQGNKIMTIEGGRYWFSMISVSGFRISGVEPTK
jgi:hypothetical protein